MAFCCPPEMFITQMIVLLPSISKLFQEGAKGRRGSDPHPLLLAFQGASMGQAWGPCLRGLGCPSLSGVWGRLWDTWSQGSLMGMSAAWRHGRP